MRVKSLSVAPNRRCWKINSKQYRRPTGMKTCNNCVDIQYEREDLELKMNNIYEWKSFRRGITSFLLLLWLVNIHSTLYLPRIEFVYLIFAIGKKSSFVANCSQSEKLSLSRYIRARKKYFNYILNCLKLAT